MLIIDDNGIAWKWNKETQEIVGSDKINNKAYHCPHAEASLRVLAKNGHIDLGFDVETGVEK